jgi:hypothetical protein
MKRIFVSHKRFTVEIFFILLFFVGFLILSQSASGATLSLEGTWTPPTTNANGTPLTDLASYNLYETDTIRTLIGNIPATATQPYLFSVTVPDGSQGTLTFVITAVDRSGNESADSAPASYQYNLSPPVTQYQVTAAAGTNGKLDATTPSPVTVNSNTTTQFKFDANTGYHVATVTNTCGGTRYTNTSNSVSTYTYTTPAITANCGVTAGFAINTYTLTYTAGPNGSIRGVSPQTVNYGASGTTVTAVPATGYSFVQWSDLSTTNPRTDKNVTANITVTAAFAINTYQVTAAAGTNGKLDATTPSPAIVSYGATTAFKFDANTGYHVATVTNTCGGTGYTNTSNSVSTYTYTTPAITANCGVTAGFAINTYTLTYTAGPNGSISGVSPQTVNYGASGTPVTAVPATGYSFVQWSDGLTTASRTDANVTANITVSATFGINQYQVTATANGNGTGNVSSNPAGINCNYPANNTGTTPALNYGTSVKLTAVAGTGSTASWGGTCISAAGTEAGDGTGTATCTFGSLNGNKTAAATFTYNTTITVPKTPTGAKTGITGNTYTYATGGSVVGSGGPVEYQFDWLGDGTDLSSWGSAKQSKIWINATTSAIPPYNSVIARARSKLNPNLVSDPSGVLAVSVTEKPFIHVTSPNGGETWVAGVTHPITWDFNYLSQNGTIYLYYWYAGAWYPIIYGPANSITPTSYSYPWTVPSIPAPPPASGSTVPKSHMAWTSVYIGNWVNGAWECWDTNDKSFKILDNGWVFTFSGADKGGAALFFNTDESSFDGYGFSFKYLEFFKIQGIYTVGANGLISGTYTITDFLSGDPLVSGNITGTLNLNATKMTLTLKNQSTPPVTVLSMSGVWLSELTIPESWSVQISGSVKGTISPNSPLTIEAYEDSNNVVYANLFHFYGSGTLSDGATPISIDGYFFFTPAKTVYGVYDQLIIGTNTPETGACSGTLNPTTGKFTFNLTSSNGHKYTLGGVATP